MLFARSLSSLLAWCTLSAIAAPAAANGDAAKQLTPDDFDAKVGKGMWLVEFFSPHCPHCVQFAPTWKKLVDAHEELETSANFHMAQVNCISYGDLCSQQKVKYYPMIQLYKEGTMQEEYSGDRAFEKLAEYIKTKSTEYTQAAQAAPAPEAKEAPLLEVRSATANPDGTVLVLTTDTFKPKLDEGPLFVKFYAPWCGHCKKLAPVWADLAAKMAGKANIAEVNCDDHSALCNEHKIQGYPTLVFFNSGHRAEYQGSRSLEGLEQFITKAVAPGLQRVKNSDIDELVKTEKVFYLFLHSLGTSQHDIVKVEQAAKPLLGTPSIVKSTDSEVAKRFKQNLNDDPVILSIKEGELADKIVVYRTTPLDNIAKWLSANRYPVIDELTSSNFQSVMRSDTNAYVVLVPLNTNTQNAKSLDDSIAALKSTSKLWRMTGESVKQRPVIFVWMDGIKWAKWLKSMYGVKVEDMPAVVIADHKNLVYYDQNARRKPIELEGQSIVNALRDIHRGHASYKNSENFVERTMRGLHNKMESLGSFVTNHPLQAMFWALTFIALIIYVLYKAVQADTQPHRHPRRLD